MIHKSGRYTSLLITAFGVALFLAGCASGSGPEQKIELKTEYQAVLLANGQVYFGKIEQAGHDFIRIKDVYYIQSRATDKSTGVAQSILLKRGIQEWHAPDSMEINTSHIVIIEPVGNDSKIAQLIKESKAKEGAK